MTVQRVVGMVIVGVISGGGAAKPAYGDQVWHDKRLYFGDAHWHSCLSQDAARSTTLTSQYESMLYDYGLDFSLQSDHAEGATAGIGDCQPYLLPRPIPSPNGFVLLSYSGEQIASAMKQAADDWNGREWSSSAGAIRFVTFPGYEWAPDARCWEAGLLSPTPNDRNSDDSTPGHINYFFSDTTGWTYHDDVWEPGDGDSGTCSVVSGLGITYYTGSKDFVDEILGQLVHQRDDPERSYDLMIQYNHPAATIDKAGSSDHVAKWFDFEHASTACHLTDGPGSCVERQCEAFRRAYGVTSVEWYTKQEASIGSPLLHGDGGEECTGIGAIDQFLPRCVHDTYHHPDLYVTSRGLREGYMLSETGGSDNHSGRRFAPNGFPGSRGAGSGSLTVVQASDATRPAIWDGLNRRHSYALSREREIGPVHKGRIDFFTIEPTGAERVMGDLIEAPPGGALRSFTISAGAETGTFAVAPVELRLYRVAADTPLTAATNVPFWWLDDVPGDPGKLGELIGYYPNPDGSQTVTHTFTNIAVHPGDAIFAVVPYSDYVWVDDFYASDESPLDADRDGQIDAGKTPYLHNNNNTWARTTPIFVRAADEHPQSSPVCEHVAFDGSGATSALAAGGGDGGLAGDDSVLPVANFAGYGLEWNRWHFTLANDADYVDLSFLTARDEDDVGHLFAVRVDGQLVYSGRAGIDHDADVIVDRRNIPFHLAAGVHLLEVHMDDQEYATGDNNPNFHCNDYDGPPGFVDSIAFHSLPDAACGDVTPPVITCPASIVVECSAFGGTPASDPAVHAFLTGATAIDDHDLSPAITNDAPLLFANGVATTVTFTATDDAGNQSSCQSTVTVGDTRPPLLAGFALAPASLAPPNHSLRAITVPTLTAIDVCDPAPRITCDIASNELPNGLGDGDKAIDIVFNGTSIATQSTGPRDIGASSATFDLKLRAERSGKGRGRIYTTSCSASDVTGNRGATRSATVTVPKP